MCNDPSQTAIRVAVNRRDVLASETQYLPENISGAWTRPPPHRPSAEEKERLAE